MRALSRRAFVGSAAAAAASAALAPISALADDSREANPAEDFLYEEVDGVVAITGYVGQAEEVVVPRSINGTLVGMVWDGAFANKTSISRVTLPEGVSYIGEGAFAWCTSLEEVVLPEGFEGPFYVDAYPEWIRLVTPEGEEVVPDGYHDRTTGLLVVEFGSYPQSGEEPEPIQWLVLEERGDGTALLMSRRCLVGKPYHSEKTDVTWAGCDLRAWLNGEFLEEALSDDERALVVEQSLANPDNPDSGASGGADTDDLVFILSLQEVEELFGDSSYDEDPRLVAHPTRRALKDHVDQESLGTSDTCMWWLRSPGDKPTMAARISPDGSVHSYGGSVDYSPVGVRPAIVAPMSALASNASRANSAEAPRSTKETTDDTTGLPVVEFGSFPQSNSWPEPIEWLVLEEYDDGTSLLLSRKCLANKRYDFMPFAGTTWEECDLRAWLNGEFLESAFSEGRRDAIVTQHLNNPDGPESGTPGGLDTDDSVFLLSLQDVEDLFGVYPYQPDPRLVACPTLRAIDEGAEQHDNGACRWWLRSPGTEDNRAVIITPDGTIDHDWFTDIDIGVRPTIVVKL